jgi:hypothetical protein
MSRQIIMQKNLFVILIQSNWSYSYTNKKSKYNIQSRFNNLTKKEYQRSSFQMPNCPYWLSQLQCLNTKSIHKTLIKTIKPQSSKQQKFEVRSIIYIQGRSLSHKIYTQLSPTKNVVRKTSSLCLISFLLWRI